MANGDSLLFKERLLKKSNGRCFYCGTLLTPETCKTEHFIPKHFGGSNRVKNLVPACLSCNARKRALTVDELRENILKNNPVHSVQFYFEWLGIKQSDVGDSNPEVYNG
jgi:5-methylcytosine-specific restriction endonuclease McrA